MKKTYLLIFIILTLIACSKPKEQENAATVVLDVSFDETPQDTLRLSSYVDSISYVKLETTDDCLLADVPIIEFVNGIYYIYDPVLSVIFMFDETGHYISKIDKKGQGPDEYLMLSAFDIHPLDGSIHIFDAYKKQMIVYTKEGKVVKTFPVKDLVRDIAVFSDGTYLFYTPDYNLGDYRRGLWRVDAEGHFIEQLVTINEDFRCGSLYPQYFCRINRDLVGLMGTEDFDNIYHIDSKTFATPFALNVDIELSDDLKTKKIYDSSKYAGKLYYKQGYAESDNYMVLTVDNLKEQRIIFYDKKQKKKYNLAYSPNDVDSVNLGYFLGGTKDRWIFGSKYFSANTPNGIHLTATEDENPILQILHLKH